ncbi:MAG TPA: hypothetical protein VLZ28_04435 [Daejeonella sp.]|nr:hypothetical protein [Daejeonella sp.]
MNNTLRLVKYHAVFLTVFSFIILLTFYLFDGGDLNTPAPLVLFYLFSALLLYIPLVLIITLLNFFILVIGLTYFENLKQQVLICLLPILLFSAWYLFSNNASVVYFLALSDFQFYSIITIWITLLIIGFSIYSGIIKYLAISVVPIIFISGWYACQKYNITSSGLRISDFQFKVIMTLWALLSSSMLFRYHPRSLPNYRK